MGSGSFFPFAAGLVFKLAALAIAQDGLRSPDTPRGERSMRHGLVLLSTGLFIAVGLGSAATVHASPDATKNQCWGDITRQFAPLGDHASAHSPFTPDPGEGGRRGVGNVSKEDFSNDGVEGTGQALAQGAQGEHAIQVGGMVGLECDGPGSRALDAP